MCLLDCEQSLFRLKICRREYLSSEVAWVARVKIRIRCSNTLAYTFPSKRETACSLYVFQCLQTFLLFSDRLNWRNTNTSNHEFSFKISAWPCHGIGTGENNVQVWQTVQVLYFGAREHLFIYLLFFILLLNYMAANAFGIWNLRNTGKSVTITEWHTHYCERFEPRSHFKSTLSLIVRVNVVTVNNNSPIQDYVHPDDQTQPTHVIVHTTLLLICLLLDAFPYIASFKPWHE